VKGSPGRRISQGDEQGGGKVERQPRKEAQKGTRGTEKDYENMGTLRRSNSRINKNHSPG